MEEFDKKSNDELIKLLEEIKLTHENIRLRMLRDFDNLERAERDYNKVQNILSKRLK